MIKGKIKDLETTGNSSKSVFNDEVNSSLKDNVSLAQTPKISKNRKKKGFGKILKAMREEMWLTQEQLGKEIGIPQQVISKYESGKRNPKYKTIKKFVEFFKVSPSYILGISPRYNNEETEDERIMNHIINIIESSISNMDNRETNSTFSTEITNNLIDNLKTLSINELLKEYLKLYEVYANAKIYFELVRFKEEVSNYER